MTDRTEPPDLPPPAIDPQTAREIDAAVKTIAIALGRQLARQDHAAAIARLTKS